jgi:hypothetical protein
MALDKDKAAFALAYLKKPDDAFGAALTVFSDTGAALRASMNWINDDEVLAEMDRLEGEYGVDAFLPTKEDICRDILKIAADAYAPTKERVNAYRLYAEVRKFIEKGTKVDVNNSVNQTHNVMNVPMPASIEEWQEKARFQQKQLVSDARPTH